MEVVSASHGALGPLLGKLTSLLADECGRLKGVRREIRSLRSELSSMHAALKEYTKLEDPNEQVKVWISLVRELAYDTEDCFDKFVHQLGNGGDHGGFKEFFRKTARRLKTLGSRRGIADQIDDLKARIKQVKELKDSYKLDENSAGTTRHVGVDPRLHALFAEEARLVGIDGPRDDLVKWMVEEENNSFNHHPRVLSIVGFGGLGKTTLANEIYRKIQGDFNCHAFVSISQKVDLKKIIKDVISQVSSQDEFTKNTDDWDEKKYIAKLKEILKDKRPAVKEEWEKVERSIGSELEKNQSLEGISSILSLSYNDLPSNLKTCLLYLSNFPEDYIINRKRLLRLWIAEFFISEERGLSQQDVAEQYFYELIDRSIVQPLKIDFNGKVNACRVHGMMFKFIISRSAKDNFVTMVASGQTGLANRQCFIRRLSIHHIDQELASALANKDLSHVRSLTVTSSCINHLPSLSEFEALRVLDFEECSNGVDEYIMNDMDKLLQLKYIRIKNTRISKLPRGIIKLRDLKYLSLRDTGISMLPQSIAELRDLETLDLRDTKINELPPAIVQLIKMQYLLISSEKRTQQGKVKIPTGISKMINLRAISGFNINKSSISAVEELGKLTSLNELHLQLEDGGSNGHEKMFLFSLGKLCSCNLQSLRIHKRRGSVEMQPPSSLKVFHLSGDYCVMDISKWNEPTLNMLVHLSIDLTELEEDGLDTLGKLPALLYLKLSFIAGPKEMITVEGTGFQSLKKLVIYSVAGAYVKFMVKAMPMLENLEVRFSVSVAKVHGFRLGIQHLLRLKAAAVSLYKLDVTSSDIKAAVAAIRDEADSHPNSPTIDICDERNEEAGSSSSQAARGFMRDPQVAYLREHPRPPAPVDPTDKGKQVISEPMEDSDDEM